MYHVLMGVLSPLNRIHPGDLRISELMTRVQGESIQEVILATSPTLEGDTTALYISEQMKGRGIKVTRIAKGLPIGSDLEYADALTLSSALSGREKL